MNLFVKSIFAICRFGYRQDDFLNFGRKIIPRPIFKFFQPFYHWLLSFGAAIIYGFPSRSLKVVGITGTSGKTTTVEFLAAIFSKAGFKTASVSGLYFRILSKTEPNMFKMTMPGRFQIQKFLKEAKKAGAEYVFLEVTSEGIKQFRHKFIKFYAAILTNLSAEHIEAHGGFENYRETKAELFKISPIHILNGDDPNFDFFSAIPAKEKIAYRAFDYPQDLELKLKGDFNKDNALAALIFSRYEGISDALSKQALEEIDGLPGRMEFIETGDFSARRPWRASPLAGGGSASGWKVLVDYAFLPQTLEKVYQTLKNSFPSSKFQVPSSNLICVFGAAGGGRDKWKRPELAKVAEKYCREIILTNEDPYDENPASILEDIEAGFSQFSISNFQFPNKFQKINYQKILDRRTAIREALKKAKAGDIVVITGKGAEPWIVGLNSAKIPWDDRTVVKEELENINDLN